MLILKIAIGVALGIGLTKMAPYDWKRLFLFLAVLLGLGVAIGIPVLALLLTRGPVEPVPFVWKVAGFALWGAAMWGITAVINWIGDWEV